MLHGTCIASPWSRCWSWAAQNFISFRVYASSVTHGIHFIVCRVVRTHSWYVAKSNVLKPATFIATMQCNACLFNVYAIRHIISALFTRICFMFMDDAHSKLSMPSIHCYTNETNGFICNFCHMHEKAFQWRNEHSLPSTGKLLWTDNQRPFTCELNFDA